METPPSSPLPPPPARYRTLSRLEAPLLNLLGMGCRHFAELALARLDRPLSRGERIRYRIHGAMCRLCGGFAQQFEVINELMKENELESAGSSSGPSPASGAPDVPCSDEVARRIAERVRRSVDQG